MDTLKLIDWKGRSKEDLRRFPIDIKQQIGFELFNLQQGKKPSNSRPFPSIGKGVFEIKVQDAVGAFRVLYVSKVKDTITVLHCFQKKSQKTSKRDIGIARQRFKDS